MDDFSYSVSQLSMFISDDLLYRGSDLIMIYTTGSPFCKSSWSDCCPSL